MAALTPDQPGIFGVTRMVKLWRICPICGLPCTHFHRIASSAIKWLIALAHIYIYIYIYINIYIHIICVCARVYVYVYVLCIMYYVLCIMHLLSVYVLYMCVYLYPYMYMYDYTQNEHNWHYIIQVHCIVCHRSNMDAKICPDRAVIMHLLHLLHLLHLHLLRLQQQLHHRPRQSAL